MWDNNFLSPKFCYSICISISIKLEMVSIFLFNIFLEFANCDLGKFPPGKQGHKKYVNNVLNFTAWRVLAMTLRLGRHFGMFPTFQSNSILIVTYF